MSRLADEVGKLTAAASPGPWGVKGGRLYSAEGTKLGALHRHGGDIDVEQRYANAQLVAAFGLPD